MVDRKHYPNLDLLRLYLALEVIWIHAQGDNYQWSVMLSPVATFVCLSGFLIPGSFASSRSWGHFAWKRALRVVPAFIVSLLIVAVLFGPSHLPPTLRYYVTAGFTAVAGSMNWPMWSLMLEEALYAFHALQRIIRFAWNPFAVGACLVSSALLWVTWARHGFAPNGDPTFHMAPVTAFFAGCLLSFYRRSLERIRLSIWICTFALFFGLCNIQWGALGISSTAMYAAVYAPLITITSVLAVALAFVAPQITFRMPDLSYGTYIYHAPILWAIQSRLALEPIPLLLGTIAVVLPFSAISWYLIEKPVLKWKDLVVNAPARVHGIDGLAEVRSVA